VTIKQALAAGAVGFCAIQFIRPAIPHPPVTADLAAPPEIKQILRASCYDCHSNETRLAWFDQIVPAYWLVARDVEQGRRHLNFSEIGRLPAAQQKGILYESVNQIQLSAMPLSQYVRLHRAAVITPAQLSALKNYINPPAPPAPPSASDIAADDSQYEKWIHASSSPSAAPAPNGIAFLPEYKNWKAISTTDRFDNHTMRAILGNEIAVRAVGEGRINPWPDGATLAKVAWAARLDRDGIVRPGAFVQVEFMIRDSRKYRATKGWGWARWRGDALAPYGKDAQFTDECVGCHEPVRDRGYVYTIPLRTEKSVPSGVITQFIDRRASTMSTLYGNDAARRYARTNSQQNYPSGSVLCLVTWEQRDDPHWFGAKIPGGVKSVEFVSTTPLRAAVMP
jgi:hypothetical protein